MAKAAKPVATTTTVCPQCNVAGPVRLAPGQVCAACEAQTAWEQLDDAGPLVIDHAAIAAAERRRAGEAAGEPWWRRIAGWLPRMLILALAGLATWLTIVALAPRRLGPLDRLLAGVSADSHHAALAGGAALVAALVGFARLRKHRQFRNLALVLAHALALVAGVVALVIGLVGSFGTGTFDGRFLTMPRAQLEVSPAVQRVLGATVIVLAPGSDGDARELALGTGAIIARDDNRAWIVTCSHVAMPYADVGSFRHAADAQPVWVQLADGRADFGRVAWVAPPPIDVAVIELPVEHAPEPVPIAATSEDLQPQSPVMFVPMPYRSGWHVQRGQLERREVHHTSAGAYDLLYTDLPVIPGDSGSGLYDARGELVGLNTWTHATGGRAEGISLPSETMRGLVDAIRAGTLGEN